MKKTIIFAMLIAIMTIASPVSAQTIVKGCIVNERSETIEYVSIGFEEDSVGTISDANGNFELEIPTNRKNDLVFSLLMCHFRKPSFPTKHTPTGNN